MQHLVGARGDTVNAHLPRTRVKQGQHFGRALAEVFLRLLRRLPFGLPTGARLRHCLERTSFVFAPDFQAELLAQRVGVLDQLFLGSASASVTGTIPAFRLRRTVPVGHQVRFS